MVCRLRQCLVLFGCVTIAFASVGEAQTTWKHVESCRTLTDAYGPFDYANSKLRTENLPNVEGIHCLALENLGAAEKTFLRALEINANSPEAAYTLGPLYVRKGDFDQA